MESSTTLIPKQRERSPANNLLEMPLHRITKEFGADGLEPRFRQQIELLDMEPADREQVLEALQLALKVHAKDKRGNDPYSTHVLRVALRIMSYYGVTDKNTIISALLHDSVEDRPAEIIAELADMPVTTLTEALTDTTRREQQEVALGLIGEMFDPEVAEIVDALTNPEYKNTDKAARHEEYRHHVRDSLQHANPKARVIKASDLIDNFAGQKHNDNLPDSKKRIKKYLPLVPDVQHAILLPDTPLSQEAKLYIVTQFNNTEQFAVQRLVA